MDQLIPVVNKLQDVFREVGIQSRPLDLPQIAVVGAQSSGKSSVLEALVGRDFLPRGSGIVTRRPLVLQLLQCPKTNGDGVAIEPWGEFLHKQNAKFHDFTQIRKEIETATDQDCGTNKGITRNPIHLKIYSPDVLNLTLVDLPGITKVPVGEQSPDIEVQIRNLVLEYITPKNCIILAVTAANQDLANSDALKIAREVDPAGDRTLGVLTKLDLMDKGTDAMDVLLGKVIPLKRGYIGVVNRSQQDIDRNKDINTALQAESDFIARHPSYSRIANRMGTAFLARTLNNILLQHIRDTLPELRAKISDLIIKTNDVLNKLGGFDSAHLSPGAQLLNLITKYSNSVVSTIDGNHPENIHKTELIGGARINYIFNQAFGPYVMSLRGSDFLSDEQILTTINNAKGPRSALFIPEQAFEMLVRQQVSKLEEPCLRCCDHVLDELQTICESREKELLRYPTLKQHVHEEAIKLLQRYMSPLREFIVNLIKIELAYVNTCHPDFYGGGAIMDSLLEFNAPQAPAAHSASTPGATTSGPSAAAAAPVQAGRSTVRFNEIPTSLQINGSDSMTDRQRRETEMIKKLLNKYYDIVKIGTQDKVPKAIIHFLVNKLKENIQNELVAALYKEQLFEELLRESDDVAARRAAAQAMLQCLTTANDTLSEIREFRIS